MITGELKSQIDKIWTDFWTGGISNPLTVIEQFTYLLFIRRLDEIQLTKEKQANLVGIPVKDASTTPRRAKYATKAKKPGGHSHQRCPRTTYCLL